MPKKLLTASRKRFRFRGSYSKQKFFVRNAERCETVRMVCEMCVGGGCIDTGLVRLAMRELDCADLPILRHPSKPPKWLASFVIFFGWLSLIMCLVTDFAIDLCRLMPTFCVVSSEPIDYLSFVFT